MCLSAVIFMRVGGLAWVRQSSTLKVSSRQRPRSAPPPTLMHLEEPAIWPSSIRTEDPTCANHEDVLTVGSVLPSNVHINIVSELNDLVDITLIVN